MNFITNLLGIKGGAKKYCINNGETPTGKQSCKVDKKGPTYKLCELYNDRCRAIQKSSEKTSGKSSKTVDKSTGRKSPEISATNVARGTVMKGLDNNMWICKLYSNGLKRWVKINSSDTKVVDKKVVDKKVDKKYGDSSSNKCVSGNKGKVDYKGELLLAKDYKDNKTNKRTLKDPTGWWASEKFDGYRALWNGKEFLSRNKNKFKVPVWFSALMPPGIALDGELYLGRNRFADCGMFKRKTPNTEEWIKSKVLFKVFDIPNLPQTKFEDRMKLLDKIIEKRKECMKYVDLPRGMKFPLEKTQQIKIKSEKHLDSLFKEIVKKKGEGVMLRQPESLYEKKRSSTLLKYKVAFDTECKIVGYKKGTGKNKNRLGSFQCRLLSDNKTTFYVSGMDDKIRDNYKKTHGIGTVITIMYNDTTKAGVPRHPRYMRKRCRE